MQRFLLLPILVFSLACHRPIDGEAPLAVGVKIKKPADWILKTHDRGGYELTPEVMPAGRLEKISCITLALADIDSNANFDSTAAHLIDSLTVYSEPFSRKLILAYRQSLRKNMGIFGFTMTVYLKYFDAFELDRSEPLQYGEVRWQMLTMKHKEENHYWQILYTKHDESVIIITFFYETPIGTSALSAAENQKWIDLIRFEKTPEKKPLL
jgi:hypothetical protein